MSLAEGTRFGPYKIGDQVGAGGMGEVYAAIDTRLDRAVAIKVLPEHLAEDPHIRERFEREARAVSSLNHPHICTLFDVGEQDGVHYLVMELVEGDTLAARLAKGRLPLDEAVEYAIQIADALDKAHRQGIVHRDLKPGNIMITKSGTKLLDFGLARLEVASPTNQLSELATLEGAEPLTAKGTIMGTLQYMAPEQVEGAETDARTDVFAFGAVVYEMVTGKRVFTGESQASLIGAILKDEPASMADFETMTPASLDHVIGRCLEKDPDQRWQTAADLMHELTWVRDAEPAALTEPGPGTTGRLIAVALATLVAGAFIAAVAMRGFSPEPSGEVIRLTLDVHEGAHVGNSSGRLFRRTFDLSPDGWNLVYVGKEAGIRSRLYLRHLDQDEAVPIPGTEGALSPSFSPDGQSIGFFRGNEPMYVRVDGGEARTISITGLGFFDPGAPASGTILSQGGFGWTDDDRILLASFDGVVEVSATGGVATYLTSHNRGPDYVQGGAQLLDGGRAVLYAEGPAGRGVPSEEANVIVENLESRVRNVVVEGGTPPKYLDSGHIVFVRSGTMMAVPFDVANPEVRGNPVVVLEDLMQAEGAGNTGRNTGIGQYSISDSGRLAYVRGGISSEEQEHYQLNWVEMAGDAEPIPLPPDRYLFPRFSPDGTRLAFLKGTLGEANSTWVYDIDREISTPLPKPTPEHENGPFDWSPDGTEIVFSSRVLDGPLNLYLTASDGSGEPVRLPESDLNQRAGSWSSSGVLAFVEDRPDGSRDIMILPMDGDSEPRPFRETPFEEMHPAFSPDGNWLAYMSEETGRSEVHVRPYPAGEPAYLISNDGGKAPAWSPNGEQLFYLVGGRRVMVVDIPGGSISAHNRPRMLFERLYLNTDPIRSYDVSPDGDRFVIGRLVRQEPKPVTRINIILNWFEELAELVPVP